MISGLILAAGESRRMGELKPLLHIGGLSFLQHIERALRAAGVHTVTAVVGCRAEEVMTQSGFEGRFAVNRNYALGQFSSLQVGVQSLPPHTRGAVVCLVDQPHVRSEWITKLIEAFERTEALIVRPRCGERFGHPVLYSARLFPLLLNLPPTENAKTLHRRCEGQTAEVELDEGILFDADERSDLDRIRSLMDDGRSASIPSDKAGTAGNAVSR